MAATAAAGVAAAAAAAFAAGSSAARTLGSPARAVVIDAADSPRISQPQQQQQQHVRGQCQSTQSRTLPQPEEAAVTRPVRRLAAHTNEVVGGRGPRWLGPGGSRRVTGLKILSALRIFTLDCHHY